jgi:hypothetical protein
MSSIAIANWDPSLFALKIRRFHVCTVSSGSHNVSKQSGHSFRHLLFCWFAHSASTAGLQGYLAAECSLGAQSAKLPVELVSSHFVLSSRLSSPCVVILFSAEKLQQCNHCNCHGHQFVTLERSSKKFDSGDFFFLSKHVRLR